VHEVVTAGKQAKGESTKAQSDLDKGETVYVAGRLRKGWLERLGRSAADLVYIPPFCDGRE